MSKPVRAFAFVALALVACKTSSSTSSSGAASSGAPGPSGASDASITKLCSAFVESMDPEKALGDKRRKREIDGCVSNMTALKQQSSKGYACYAACLSKATSPAPSSSAEPASSANAVDPCVARCAQDIPELGAVMDEISERESEKHRKAEDEELAGFPKLAEKVFEATFEQTKVRITLTEGFKHLTEGKTSLSSKVFTIEGDAGSELTVSLSPSNLDLETAANKIPAEEILKQEKTDKGWVIHVAGRDNLSLRMQTKAGDSPIDCEFLIFGKAALAKKDTLLPWAEKLCGSIRPAQ